MRVVKKRIEEPDGIVMANGMVLKDGMDGFKADKDLVSDSLSYVAKISKGLHSGVLNSDPDFVKFQQEAMEGIINKETDKVCSKAVLNAEKNLRRLSNKAAQAAGTNYIFSSRNNKKVTGIDLGSGEFIEEIGKSKKHHEIDAKNLESLLGDIGTDLASFNSSEIKKIKKTNQDIKKRRAAAEKKAEKKAKKKVTKKKVGDRK